MYTTINCVVLNKENSGEYDRVVTVYSLELGKLKVLFKSVNKPTAKLLFLTLPATEVELYLYLSKFYSGYKAKVVGGKLLNFYPEIKNDLQKYIYICKILETVDNLTLDLLRDEKKYNLLIRALQLFSSLTNYETLYLSFIIKFIKLCGYMPEIYRCVKCKKFSNSTEWYFNWTENGLICKECLSNIDKNSTVQIFSETINLLQKFYILTGIEINKLQVSNEILTEAKNILYKCLQNYLHSPLKTWS